MIRTATSILAAVLFVTACSNDSRPPASVASASPSAPDRGFVRWVSIGDFGKGDEFQQRVADRMCLHHSQEPFDWVVTTGDNIYPTGDPRDFEDHFEEPYSCLFEAGVRFHSSLGNHDAYIAGGRPEIEDPLFGMPARFYSWDLGPVTFLMLDSNNLDDEQVSWLDEQLAAARSRPWTVAVFHHPLYSAGVSHGSDPDLQELLSDRFAESGVDLVLNGHDHVFASSVVDDVSYIVTGGGGAQLDLCVLPNPEPVDQCLSYLHFTEVEATKGQLTATVVADSGDVLTTIDVARND